MVTNIEFKKQRRERRKHRTKKKIFGTPERPRLSVFRSLKHIYAQIINDEKEETLVAASDLEIKNMPHRHTRRRNKKEKIETAMPGKVAVACEVGKLIAEKALKHKIKKVVFDRGSFLYHGRVKALADGARAGGLEF